MSGQQVVLAVLVAVEAKFDFTKWKRVHNDQSSN